jgi:hypothetical protein
MGHSDPVGSYDTVGSAGSKERNGKRRTAVESVGGAHEASQEKTVVNRESGMERTGEAQMNCKPSGTVTGGNYAGQSYTILERSPFPDRWLVRLVDSDGHGAVREVREQFLEHE